MSRFDELVGKYKAPLGVVADNLIKRFLIDEDKKEEIIRIGLQAIKKADEQGIHNFREVVQSAMVSFIKANCKDYNGEFIDAYRRSSLRTQFNAFKTIINAFKNNSESFRIIFDQTFSFSRIENPQVFDRIEGEVIGIGKSFGRVKRIDAGTRKFWQKRK